MTESVFKLTKPRILLLVIIIMFIIPLGLAKFYWGYLNEHGVSSTVNNGTLISPALPLMDMVLLDTEQNALPAKLLKGRWTYVIFAESSCNDVCRQQLLLTKNARLLVNKDMQRVNRLLVMDHQPETDFLKQVKQEHPHLTIAVLTHPIWTAFVTQFQSGIDQIGGSPFFLVDPLGNLMMGYDDLVSPKDILSDLKKLLKISMIG